VNWASKRVLVTGAAGFIGSHLTERLVELGARMRAAVRYNSRKDWGLLELLPDAVKSSPEICPLGYNYRLDEIRAALGLIQLRKLPAANARRGELTRRYRAKLQDIPGLTLPFAPHLEDAACHLFPVILPPGTDRAGFMAALAGKGIQTAIHYPPRHHFSYYQSLWPPDFDHGLPRTEEVPPVWSPCPSIPP
jgi:dTDP-4-amino-4,6-dideoxygalactose transaminase